MWGSRVSPAHCLLENLKHKSWNLKRGKRKKERLRNTSVPNSQLSKSIRISKTKELMVGSVARGHPGSFI